MFVRMTQTIIATFEKDAQSFILAYLGVFFKIWLQQFFCILNVSFSSAFARESEGTQLRLHLLVLICRCACVGVLLT